MPDYKYEREKKKAIHKNKKEAGIRLTQDKFEWTWGSNKMNPELERHFYMDEEPKLKI